MPFNLWDPHQSVSDALIHMIDRHTAIQVGPIVATFAAGPDVDASALGLPCALEAVSATSTAIDGHQRVRHPASSFSPHEQAAHRKQSAGDRGCCDHPSCGL